MHVLSVVFFYSLVGQRHNRLDGTVFRSFPMPNKTSTKVSHERPNVELFIFVDPRLEFFFFNQTIVLCSTSEFDFLLLLLLYVLSVFLLKNLDLVHTE